MEIYPGGREGSLSTEHYLKMALRALSVGCPRQNWSECRVPIYLNLHPHIPPSMVVHDCIKGLALWKFAWMCEKDLNLRVIVCVMRESKDVVRDWVEGLFRAWKWNRNNRKWIETKPIPERGVLNLSQFLDNWRLTRVWYLRMIVKGSLVR